MTAGKLCQGSPADGRGLRGGPSARTFRIARADMCAQPAGSGQRELGLHKEVGFAWQPRKARSKCRAGFATLRWLAAGQASAQRANRYSYAYTDVYIHIRVTQHMSVQFLS